MAQEPVDAPPEMTFFGVDFGSGKDTSAEVEYRLLPDGTREIIAIRTWQHELELTADHTPTAGQTMRK